MWIFNICIFCPVSYLRVCPILLAFFLIIVFFPGRFFEVLPRLSFWPSIWSSLFSLSTASRNSLDSSSWLFAVSTSVQSDTHPDVAVFFTAPSSVSSRYLSLHLPQSRTLQQINFRSTDDLLVVHLAVNTIVIIWRACTSAYQYLTRVSIEIYCAVSDSLYSHRQNPHNEGQESHGM